MRRQVKVGQEFDLSVSGVNPAPEADNAAEKKARRARSLAVGREFEATVEFYEMRTRVHLTWAALSIVGALLLGAGAYGMYNDDFSGLKSVWNAAGPVVGGIFSFYFFKRTGSRRADR